METDVKLTKLASCAGCGAKVGAGTLSRMLAGFRTHSDPRLLVGYDKSDDAGDRQFPVGAASLISSRAGYFSLGYCHAVHLLGLNASRHIVYILSRSCCRAANLGSGSGLQLQGPRLRLAPQRKHRPLQSGLQSS